ncbi:MAG: hypothetical protein P8Q46_04770 [Candidatus Thalassarchaeaceae archaeon]|nr:hypothetical protein [Candidatus Thalassarchaeaceae archaeon]
MRRLLAVLLTVIILLPIQASAASDSLWDEARVFDEIGTYGGTIGGISIDMNNTSDELTLNQSSVAHLPRIVEVYTATWCLNCVKTEQALDEALENLGMVQSHDVTRIHYHRYLYETLDPFGSNSTDSRWVDSYGSGSLLSTDRSYESSDGRTVQITGTERSAPSKVFDGQRMYTGTSTKSNSLQTDYQTALHMFPSHPFSHYDSSLQLAVLQDNEAPELSSFQWNISLFSGMENWEITSWLMFVENSAYFPEGSNGKGNYSHVLHEAINIGSQNASSILLDPPEPWDGDDMSVILLVDWTIRSPTDANSIPAPALSTLLCMLAALVPRRDRFSEPMQ